MKIGDANIILRYFLSDNAEQFLVASDLIEDSELFFPMEIIAEVVYVLKKVYKVNRKKISSLLSDLFKLPNITTTNKEILKDSLYSFSETSLDFVDCILIAYKRKQNYEVVTFDKQLKSFLEKNEISN